MHLYLFDGAGSLSAYPDMQKGYVYTPRVRDQSYKKALQSTGLFEYIYVMHVLHVIIFKYYF